MAKKESKFPETLYVRREEDGDDVFYIAFENDADAIEGDGPTKVATFVFTSTHKLVKTVDEV